MGYEQEKINPYEKGVEKTQQVEQMFDNIAPTYDKLNHRLSWDIDRGWRKKAILQLKPYQPTTLLDIATGTGDFAILAAEMLHPSKLIGADISEGMMEIGRQKVKAKGLDAIISFEKEDCTALSYPETRRTSEYCRTHYTRQFPDATTLSYLQSYDFAYLWTAHIKRYQRL